MTGAFGILFFYSLSQLGAARQYISEDLLFIPDIYQTPVKTFSPPTPPYNGAVLLVHGYGGSKEMLQGLAIRLAKEGFYTFSLDLPGCGDSQGKFSMDQNLAALESAYYNLLGRALLTPDKVALIGHSLGGTVAMQFAELRREIRSTISLSAVPKQLPSPPLRNLLVLAEEHGAPVLLQGIESLWEEGFVNDFSGDFTSGAARSATLVPGTNHLTIVYSTEVHDRISHWLRSAFQISDNEVKTQPRNRWIILAHLSSLLLFVPLAYTIFAHIPASEELLIVSTKSRPLSLAAWVPSALLGGLLSSLLPYRPWIPLRVADYFSWALFFSGLLIVLSSFALGFKIRIQRQSIWKPLLAGVSFFLYIYWSFGLAANREWIHFGLSGGRWLVLLKIALLVAPLFFALELALRQYQQQSGLIRTLLLSWFVYGVLLLGLFIPSTFGVGFVDIFLHRMSLPFMVVFFVVFPFLSTFLFSAVGSTICGALWNTLIYSWLLAAPFPWRSDLI